MVDGEFIDHFAFLLEGGLRAERLFYGFKLDRQSPDHPLLFSERLDGSDQCNCR
jgi:hypothetical protein